MTITTLLENTANNPQFKTEHGLSLVIERGDTKILFDTGASDYFAMNADVLGLDLSTIDAAVLSHGHYDHGGGLSTFFARNDKAPLYIRKEAFGPFYSQREDGQYHYIGLDKNLMNLNRLIFTSAYTPIAEGLSVFSKVEQANLVPTCNLSLFKKEGESYQVDSFTHEQYLVVEEGTKSLLVSGCSHRGIVNILAAFHERWGYYPTHVIGGFHLYNHRTGKPEEPEVLKQIADILLQTKAKFYTCHCTGEENYQALKILMNDKIEYLRGSDILQF